ncbi:MAG: hypothetical protein A2Z25_14095 [Planctomycetes bacterium RBG_16_55_9]|nr:MAG: hypothetical protein A2Z25_14095 [Planctomycetes bacterium RBG_16_55_9]
MRIREAGGYQEGKRLFARVVKLLKMLLREDERRTEEGDDISRQREEVSRNVGLSISQDEVVSPLWQGKRRL